jgi:hypothetical protein
LHRGCLIGAAPEGDLGIIGAKNVDDNDKNDLQRIRALEASIGKLRKDLERVERMLRLTQTKPRLKQQKGAIEKLFYVAQVELGKVRKKVKR